MNYAIRILFLAIALFSPITPAQAANGADNFISDSNGCKVNNNNPSPNESITWSGACQNGYANGVGVLQWYVNGIAGTRVEGNFINGLASGKMKITTSKGGLFEGDYVEGKKSGKGKLVYEDGVVYEGDWLDNKRNGKGKLTQADSEDFYEGDWLNGQQTGQGKSSGGGEEYEGGFIDGRRNGKGKFTWGDNVYEGDFVLGERSGKGKLTKGDGEIYEGDFVNGRYEGKGVLTMVDPYIQAQSFVYQGDFVHGLPHGKGKITWANGDSYEGEVFEGQRTENGVFLKAAKPRLVLMPLRLNEKDRGIQAAMEAALVEGLQKKYDVIFGERVQQEVKRVFAQESATVKKECDETRCMETIADTFKVKLMATASVTQQDGGYFLAINILNIFDNKIIQSESTSCKNCDSFEVIDKLKKMVNP